MLGSMFQFCFQFGKEEKEEGREKKLREEGRREGGGREGEKVELNSVYQLTVSNVGFLVNTASNVL